MKDKKLSCWSHTPSTTSKGGTASSKAILPGTATFRLFFLVVALVISTGSNAFSQQRSIVNPGFDLNDANGPGAPSFQIVPDSSVPGWVATTGEVELWDSGFLGVSSFTPPTHVEMNANAPGALFQNICLVSGETIQWNFSHQARSGGANPQIALFEIANSSGTVLQTLATQSSSIGSGWQVNSGSAAYTGATGVQRVQFRTSNPGSVGNFLDTIQIDLQALAEFEQSASSDSEGTGGNVPRILVSGTVDVSTTIPVTVTGGTATGADFTLSPSSVTIPPGTYASTPFVIPLTITDDSDVESNETIVLSLGTPTTSEIRFNGLDCVSSGRQTNTYTIIDDDPRMAVVKTAVVNDGGDRVDAGETISYTYTVTNTGSVTLNDVDVSEISGNFTGNGLLPTPVHVSGGANLDGDGDEPDLAVGGGSIVFAATYIIVQQDINSESVTNQALASATSPNGTGVSDLSDESGTGPSDNDPTVASLPALPSLTVSKVADDDTSRAVNDDIEYTYTIRNTGNVPISAVGVSDVHNGSGPAPTSGNEALSVDVAPLLDSTDASVNGVWDLLGPGDTITMTGNYIVTQQDVDNLQ